MQRARRGLGGGPLGRVRLRGGHGGTPPRRVRVAKEGIELFFCPDARRWYHYKDEDSWCWADAFIEVYTDPCSKQDYYFDFKTGNWCWAYHVPSEFEGMYFDC